jgi:hypothetical protein
MTQEILNHIQRSAILLLILFVLCQCGPSRLDLTPSASRGFVQGTVTAPDGQPLVGVSVNPENTPVGAILPAVSISTDQQGHYRWALDTPGRYTFQAVATGYISQTKEVVVQPNSTATLDFVLEPEGP